MHGRCRIDLAREAEPDLVHIRFRLRIERVHRPDFLHVERLGAFPVFAFLLGQLVLEHLTEFIARFQLFRLLDGRHVVLMVPAILMHMERR